MDGITDGAGRELKRHGTYDFPCNAYRVSGGGFPWHWHDELEMLYVESGVLVFAAASQRFILQAGDGVMVNRDVPHAVFPHENAAYEECDIVFHPRLLYGGVDTTLWDRYFRSFLNDANRGGFPLYHTQPWQSQAAEGIRRACRAVEEKRPMYEFAVREELTKTYLAVWAHAMDALASERPAHPQRDDRVKGMMRFLETNAEKSLSLKDLAAFANLSPRACQREFQACLGMTPFQYLNQWRLNRAAGLLRSGKGPVTEIAYQCGFQDAGYFARQFRLRYGISPRGYRARQ